MRYLYRFFYAFIEKRKRLSIRKMFENYFARIICVNKFPNKVDQVLVNDWERKWGVFGMNPSSKSFVAYNKFMNGNKNTVPNEIARNFIEPILTPEEYQPFYNDKNSFGIIIPKELMPKTYLRSINGILYDGDYNPIRAQEVDKLFESAEKLIVKPSKDMGGHGVSLFSKMKDLDGFYDSNNNKLTVDFLLSNYDRNFLVQECMKQSSYMSQFNPTSVNTIRIATYRDVHTGDIRILGAVLRIGGKGAFIDNACSGGSFVSVDENGCLGKYVCTQYGETAEIYNDINFSTSTFIIPKYDKIKAFVKTIAQRLPHMSLFANDIAIDENGDPKLIEVNTTDFSYWFYQFNGKPVFGEYTDDVIQYALKEQKRLEMRCIHKYL